jgi:hypothetical protein
MYNHFKFDRHMIINEIVLIELNNSLTSVKQLFVRNNAIAWHDC